MGKPIEDGIHIIIHYTKFPRCYIVNNVSRNYNKCPSVRPYRRFSTNCIAKIRPAIFFLSFQITAPQHTSTPSKPLPPPSTTDNLPPVPTSLLHLVPQTQPQPSGPTPPISLPSYPPSCPYYTPLSLYKHGSRLFGDGRGGGCGGGLGAQDIEFAIGIERMDDDDSNMRSALIGAPG